MKQIGRKIIRLESVDSTNNYTANLIKQGNIESGSVILAVEQYSGRGQRGAEWLVKPGENLTCSIYLDDVNVSVENQFFLTKVISLAVLGLLKKYSVDARIKWPNDIYVNDQKIAGILIENSISGNKIKNSIIGIGLNINQTEFGTLPASSIQLETDKFVPVDEVLFALIASINDLLQWNESIVNKVYLEKLYLINELSDFRIDGQITKGTIKGVSANGKLQVELEDSTRLFDLKEIEFIPQNVL